MKVLLFGTLSPPYNGQSIAFTTIYNAIEPVNKLVINTAKFNNRIINTLYAIILTYYYFTFHRFSTIYFTSSRSKLGFIKDFPLLVLGRWTKKRIINHLHGADFEIFYQTSGFLKPFIQYAYANISVSIVLLDEMKKEFSDFPKINNVVIGNCYSDDFDKSTLYIHKKKMQLVFLSNLMKSKGILEFLDACNLLLKKYPLLEVKIAGSFLRDNYMNSKAISELFFMKYQVLKNIFTDRILYLGIVKGNEKVELLFESSIFILPSYYSAEAFPISIIEAMRAGNAIVATNHNYLPDIVKPENGILIEPYSSEAIIEGVELLLNDKVKLQKIQQQNIEETKKKYSQDTYISSVKSIIQSS